MRDRLSRLVAQLASGAAAWAVATAPAAAHPSGLPQLKQRADMLIATSGDWLFWDFHPSIVIGLLLLSVGYARWLRVAGPGVAVDHRRRRWYYGAMVLAWCTLDGPLHHLADELLFAAHMVQHLVLQLIWAPMFLFGVQPWMWERILDRVPGILPLAHALTRPRAAFLLYNGMIWVWHLPSLYNLALLSHNWHIVEHLLFMSTALVFWWPLLGSTPRLPRPAFGAQMLYVFANMVAMKALGMIISLQDEVIYTFYLQVPRVWGLSPLADQQLGGMLMWLPGGLLLWGGLGYVFLQWATRGTPPRGQSGIAQLDAARAAGDPRAAARQAARGGDQDEAIQGL